jgi:hypothetical protein
MVSGIPRRKTLPSTTTCALAGFLEVLERDVNEELTEYDLPAAAVEHACD